MSAPDPKSLKLERERLIEAAATGSPEVAARATVKLAEVQLALGERGPAKAAATRAFATIVAGKDAALQGELARVLAALGENLAAEALDRLRRGGSGGGERAATLARVLASLNSCAAGTAEPLLEILKAVIEETGAARGFLMLHEGSGLRYELGLTRTGRRLAASDFAFSTTIVERALETGRPVLVPDLTAVKPYALASSAQSLGLRSALCAPLRVERRRSGAASGPSLPHVRGVAGVLYVDSTATGSFSEDDARFFEALADATVLALRASGGRPSRSAPEPEPEAGLEPRSVLGIETRAPSMMKALHLLERVARTDASVVLQGESGTGKELFARALHAGGRRAKGPFVALECSAVGDELIRHELFGHEDGAFTGAGPAREGLVERASGGTLFLDAVDEMPAAMQAALLRVLQEGEVRRLGGDKPRPVDVRLVAATQRDLASLVEKGAFRHDLLFRLAVVEIRIPPLRERIEDLELLVPRLLARIAAAEKRRTLGVEDGLLERLAEHAWPGNVRELENVLRAGALAARDGTIRAAHVEALLGPRHEAPAIAKAAPIAGALAGTMEDIERRAIEERLRALDWNQVRAAESLGLDRTTLRRKMTRYGIARPGGD